jgi:hypothetical protein
MHDERVTGEARFDLFQNVEVEGLFALEFKSAVRGADGAGQGIAAGLFDEVFGFDGVGEAGITFLNFDVFFDAAEHTEFGFDRDAFGVRPIDDAPTQAPPPNLNPALVEVASSLVLLGDQLTVRIDGRALIARLLAAVSPPATAAGGPPPTTAQDAALERR